MHLTRCRSLEQSYHDLAVRLEPIILELEREQNDLLIIAHESVLRVLYGYLMHCSTMEIPELKFPRCEIIEIIPAAYQNNAKRIHIPGLDHQSPHGFPNVAPAESGSDSAPPPSASSASGGSASGPDADSIDPLAEALDPLTPSLDRRPEEVVTKAQVLVADKVNDED